MQNIIRPDSQLLERPKSSTASKRPRNKRTTTESKPAKPHYIPPASNKDTTVDDTSPPPADPIHKGRKRHKNSNNRDIYPTPAKVPKNMKEPNESQQPNIGLRRSPRVRRVTAKCLESIKAELKDPDERD